MTTDDRSKLPYQNGLLAAENGKDRTADNPYALYTPNSTDWLAGFDSYTPPESKRK